MEHVEAHPGEARPLPLPAQRHGPRAGRRHPGGRGADPQRHDLPRLRFQPHRAVDRQAAQAARRAGARVHRLLRRRPNRRSPASHVAGLFTTVSRAGDLRRTSSWRRCASPKGWRSRCRTTSRSSGSCWKGEAEVKVDGVKEPTTIQEGRHRSAAGRDEEPGDQDADGLRVAGGDVPSFP